MAAALRSERVCDGRIYDLAPPNAGFPHIEFGDTQTVDDGAECLDSVEVTQTIDIWSRSREAAGRSEAVALCAVVRAILHQADLVPSTWRLVEIRHRDSRVFLDADGLTWHGVVTFRAKLDPA